MQANLGRSEPFVLCTWSAPTLFPRIFNRKQTYNSGAVQPIMSAFRRHNGLINLCAAVLSLETGPGYGLDTTEDGMEVPVLEQFIRTCAAM